MSEESMRKNRARKTLSIQEPTTSKNEKRTSLQAGHFLRTKHPELFEIKPLPGGYRRHANTREDAQNISIDSKTPEAKISFLSTQSRSGRGGSIADILATNIRCPNTKRALSKDDRNDNTVKMCSIAISTVMMLAQRTYDDITMQHVRHTEEYFRGLRQPEGYPANVGQLMQLLTGLKDRGSVNPPIDDRENDQEEKRDEQDAEMPINEQIS